MNLFQEQVEERKRNDETTFRSAFKRISRAASGLEYTVTTTPREEEGFAITRVLRSFGISGEEEVLPPSVKTLEEEMEYRFRPYGIMRHKQKLRPGWHKTPIGPMIGRKKKDGGAVALIPGAFSGYEFYDPATDRHVKITRANEELFEEEAIVCYKPFPLRSLERRDLIRFLLGNLTGADIAILAVSTFGVTALGMLLPYYTRIIFGDIIDNGDSGALIGVAIYLFAVTLARLVFTFLQNRIHERIALREDYLLRTAFMTRILSLPTSFFHEYSSGELTRTLEYMSTFYTDALEGLFRAGVSALMSLLFVIEIRLYGSNIAVPAILVAILTTVFYLAAVIAQTDSTRKEMESTAKENGVSFALIRGMTKIRMTGSEKRAFAFWADRYAEVADAVFNAPAVYRFEKLLRMVITFVGLGILYVLSAGFSISVPVYYAVSMAYGFLLSAFMALADTIGPVSRLAPSLELAEPILRAVPEVDEGRSVVSSIRGEVAVSNLYFRYSEDDPYIVNGLNLYVRSGEYVAVVGATGSGKSTLLRLLLGFERPAKGSVFYDNRDMNRLDLKSLRNKIGVVLQDSRLFTGTVKDNILLACPDKTEEDAWRAAEIADIADEIRKMPLGMDTVISEGSGSLSGGQKQRILIAQALAPDPKILILDEATSALDNLSQERISKAIDALKCTRIVIAHRLSTIKLADRILVLDEGVVKEDGTYEELMARDSLFAHLAKTQQI